MFLLPLALMAMSGGVSPETPDNLPPTPPPVRVKVEIIEITLTPQDRTALGDKALMPNTLFDHFRTLDAYTASHHLLQTGDKIAEGILQGDTPIRIQGYEFRNPRITAHHVHLSMEDRGAEEQMSRFVHPLHFQDEIGAESGEGCMVGFTQDNPKKKTALTKITGLTYARLTLLPPGKV